MRMYVNPFWFGVLMTIVGFMALMLIIAIVRTLLDKGEAEDIDVDEEEYRQMMEELTGRKMKVYRSKDGYLVAEPEEEDDDDDPHS